MKLNIEDIMQKAVEAANNYLIFDQDIINRIVKNISEGIEKCKEINYHGGLGHTVSIFSYNKEKIEYFASVMNAGRVIVNTPSSQGALGGKYNSLHPSLTLACGTGGGNITTDNISARHLLNIQRIAWRRESICLKHLEQGIHFDESINADTFEKNCIKQKSYRLKIKSSPKN